MSRHERLQAMERMLAAGRHIPISKFMEKLQRSKATITRDIEYLRSRSGHSIDWDREQGGYRLVESSAPAPSMWFTGPEIHALLTMQHLLQDLQPGFLDAQLAPLQKRVETLLGKSSHTPDEIRNRVRIVHVGRRLLPIENFEHVAQALLNRKRLRINYYNRARDNCDARDISPQRLVHYRENWYLDAWCHWKNDIRTFSLDAIKAVRSLLAKAKTIPDAELDRHFKAGYGIFSGKAKYIAKLKFSGERARWVGNENWHPDQTGQEMPDGTYLLTVPVSDHRELLMDIMKHGTHVEVLEPEALRQVVSTELRAASSKYS